MQQPFSRTEALSMWTRIVAGWADHLDESGARLRIDGVTNQHDRGGSYEGVTRMLWGLGGWLSVQNRDPAMQFRGNEYDLLDLTKRAFLSGTDPESPGYWGVPTVAGASDQRTVESGQVAFALWQSRARIWDTFSDSQRLQITEWLKAAGEHPALWRNNWALFWALNHHVRAALGVEHDPTLVPDVLNYLDTVYCGNGWYDDGPTTGTNHFDDYNLWVFASHVLAWAQIEPGDSQRKRELLDRVRQQMEHVPYFFAADGAYPEYGRSLSYKFARLGALIWAYQAGVWPHSTGMLKRLVGRHLRWYIDRDAVRADGSIRQELTSEGSSEIRETYVSTGATYWAMQAFGALWSLPDDDPFWTVDEEPLPVETGDFIKVFPEPGFVLVGTQATGAVQRFASHSHHNAAKYGKFHYTTPAPFNVGLIDGDPLPDAMMCLTNGESIGHKNEVLASGVGESGWLRFRYRQQVGAGSYTLETIIVPLGESHIRIHKLIEIDAGLGAIHAIEGASPLGFPFGALPQAGIEGVTSWASNAGVMVAIAGVRGYERAGKPSSFGAPGANSVYGSQVIPWLKSPSLAVGSTLVCIVHIGSALDEPGSLGPSVRTVEWRDDGICQVDFAGTEVRIIPPI